MLFGSEIFREYEKAKSKFKDLDTWTAEAIKAEFGADKQGPLMAAKIAKTTKLPWKNPTVFENIALVLNGREALPDVDQDISVKEISYAVKVLNSEFPNDEFDEAILKYFAAEAGEEGMTVLPPNMRGGQKYIPNIFLNIEQQHIQKAYLEECQAYVDMLSKSEIA